MTTKVTCDHLFFAFEPKLQPALHIEQSENICIISVRRSRDEEKELYESF